MIDCSENLTINHAGGDQFTLTNIGTVPMVITSDSRTGTLTTIPAGGDWTTTAAEDECFFGSCVDAQSEDSGITLDCPTGVINSLNQTYTQTWTDPNAPTTRRYDLWINGQDTSNSVLAPATSQTTDDPLSTYVTGTSGTFTVELFFFDDGNFENAVSAGTCEVQYQIDVNELCTAGPDNCGRLYGVTIATSNNTDWAVGSPADNRGAHRHAIPIISLQDTINEIQIYMRNDGQAGNLGGYTEGDGGTIRVLLVNDNNCEPDLGSVVWTGPETVGDAVQWPSQAAFQAAYPGAQWIPSNTSALSAQRHDTGNLSVTRCERYWIVVEQVRGGSANHSSVNYMRSGYSDDFARNWLDRTDNPCIDGSCILPQTQTTAGVWSEFDRHPIYTVTGNAGVQGMPYYNKGVGVDDETGVDRMPNANSSGDAVRNLWQVPGTQQICKVWVAAAIDGPNPGTGDLVISIDGQQVGTIPSSAYLESETEVNPTALDDLRWAGVNITPVTVSGTAIFEITATGSANFEIGGVVEEPWFDTQAYQSGTPDVDSQTRLNNGAWQQSASNGRLKHAISWNVVADGTPGNCLEDQCDCPL